jgi:2-dehydropantoate 2-reductase
MRILVIGAGAVGGWLAGTLARGGAEVAVLARGATLAAIRADGLTLIDGGRREIFRLPAADRPEALPRPDIVILAVKTYAFADAVAWAEPAFAHGPALVTAMNGLPWWFLLGLAGPLEDQHLETIDPDGRAAAQLGNVQPIGAVVHASMRAEAPGVISIPSVDRLILGDPDGRTSAQTASLARLVEAGGVKCPLTAHIRLEIWSKLWGNMNMNPINTLTGLSAHRILADPHLSGLVRDMMTEFVALGARIGLQLPITVAERLVIMRRLGDFRTSMLNDLEAGRALEIEGLLGVVVEMAGKVGLPVPSSRAVYALARTLQPGA